MAHAKSSDPATPPPKKKKKMKRATGIQRATLRQLRSYKQGLIARAFSSNSLVNTMEITAVIKYILTAAQSLGSLDYYKRSRMTVFGLASVLFSENEQAFTKWIIVCSEENTYLDA